MFNFKTLLLLCLFVAGPLKSHALESLCQNLFSLRFSSYPEGTIPISGYASVFDVRDDHGQVTTPQAFESTVKDFNARKQGDASVEEIYMQYNHSWRTDVGRWTHMEIDAYGLYVEGYIDPRQPDAQKMLAAWRARPFNGLSVGGEAESRFNGKEVVIESYPLREISLVTQGSNPKATFSMPASPETERTRFDMLWEKIQDFIKSEVHRDR